MSISRTPILSVTFLLRTISQQVSHCQDIQNLTSHLTLMKAMMSAMTSLSMWKLSATRAMELVR